MTNAPRWSRDATTTGARMCPSIALLVGAMFAATLLYSPAAEARPRPAGKARKSFEANKTFGIGLMFGAPTGLSGKYFLSPNTAIDFGLGTIYGYRDRRGLHVHGDYLWHPLSLASTDAFELPLYFGVGARLLTGNRCYRYNRGSCDYNYDGYTALGVRGPLGISFDFNKVPLDVFIEFAIVLDA